MGVPTYGKFFALISLAVFVVSQLNLFVAIRIYRKKMSVWRTLLHSFQVGSYVFAHWVPVIFVSFCQIIFGKSASTWHPTEHVGVAHSLTDAT
jgi:hypothetical protein